VARHRRRRERRDRPEHPEQRGQRAEKRGTRQEAKRREAFEAARVSLIRRRRFIGALAFLPLIGNLGCAIGITPACAVPTEWWLAIFAALFGSYLGITLRLFLDRRRYARESAADRSS
jgi:membrane associated rhomboid family serine protease